MKFITNCLFTRVIFITLFVLVSVNNKILPSENKLQFTPEQEERKNKLNNIMMRALTSVVTEKALGLKPEGLNYRSNNQRRYLENEKWGKTKKEEYEKEKLRESNQHKYETVKRKRKLNEVGEYSHLENEQNLFMESEELNEAKNEDKLIQEERHRRALNNELTEEDKNEMTKEPAFQTTGPVPDDAIYMSNFPRVMTVAATISKLYNTFNQVIPGDIANTDILEKTEQGLKTYKMGKEFFTIIIHESQDLQREVDGIFSKSTQILVTFEEMLILMGFDDYYATLRTKVDTKEHQFIELDNQLKFEINDFVDKARYFLVALDNLRNISNYLYIELQPFEEKYASDSLLNIIDKIDQGVGMVDAILQLKIRMEGLLNNLTNGVNKLFVVRNNMSSILIEMHKLIPQFENVGNGENRIWSSISIAIGIFVFMFKLD